VFVEKGKWGWQSARWERPGQNQIALISAARNANVFVTVGSDEGLEEGKDYTVGTMIELPRACFVADRIAQHADPMAPGQQPAGDPELRRDVPAALPQHEQEPAHPGPTSDHAFRSPATRRHRSSMTATTWSADRFRSRRRSFHV